MPTQTTGFAQVDTAAASEARAERVCSRICLGIAILCSLWMILMQTIVHASMASNAEDLRHRPILTACVLSLPYRLLLPALVVAGVVKEIVIRNKFTTLVLNGIHILLVFGIAAADAVGMGLITTLVYKG